MPRTFPSMQTGFLRALIQADRVLKEFRARFIGKCSPVHFFWGSFDLAVTRFSGRLAPPHPGGIPHMPDWVVREAYSHEVSSCGFWPGNVQLPQPVFYSYAYPEPQGFRATNVRPADAAFNSSLGEFILPYEAVRRSASPDATLLEFLQSTYEGRRRLRRVGSRRARACRYPGTRRANLTHARSGDAEISRQLSLRRGHLRDRNRFPPSSPPATARFAGARTR